MIICVKVVIFRELYKIIIILRCYSSLPLGPTLHFPKIVSQGNESLMMGLGLTGKHFCEMGTFQQPIKLYQIGSLLFQMFIIFSYLPDLYSFFLGNTVRILKRVLIRRMLQRLTWNCFKSLLLFKEMCTRVSWEILFFLNLEKGSLNKKALYEILLVETLLRPL